jgi:gamma-glutamyltranspeptidase/glutathione hydrolase
MGTNGMITSAHALASAAGLQVLRDGGNAVDAAVTAGAVLAVVQPDASGVGGDAFMLHYDAATHRVTSMNASGRSPRSMTLEVQATSRGPVVEGDDRRYAPGRGPLSVSVPGAVHGWADALARHGTIDLADALAPSISYAERGFPVSVRLSDNITNGIDTVRRNEPLAATFLDGDAPYRPGQMLRQPALARTLRAIAEDGPGAFYQGDVADRIVDAQRRDGGCLEASDFSGQETLFGEPLTVDYHGYTVYDQPPVSLGLVLLEELALVEGFELAALPVDSAERAHLLIEAKKLAFADLEAHLTDPAFHAVPVADLLAGGYVDGRRQLIDLDRASDGYGAGDPTGYGHHTSYLSVVDGNGNAVSWIQSIFESFGSGWMAPDTGVIMNNRMKGFSLEPGHVNQVEGGKRTAHTLNAPMVLKDGRPYLVFGTPGSYGQVQTNLQMLTAHIDHGLDIATMVEGPRWRSVAGREVCVETRFPDATLRGLSARGHQLQLEGAWSARMGDAQAIRIVAAEGVLQGAADPRRESYAIGW